MDNDSDLLRAWIEKGDEDAFRALVDRHINLVYSVARRAIADERLAEDVAQATFIVLARKASSLIGNKALTVWLYRATQFAAAQAVRAEARRTDRLRTFATMQNSQTDQFWDQAGPIVDRALARLSAKDREPLILRFMGEMTIQQVGSSLGISEEAARKRIDRSLEKLRAVLSRQGSLASVAVLAASLAQNSVQAAPIGLASKVAAATLASTATTSATTAAIVKGTIQFMAWTKVKIIGLSVTVLLLGTTATVLMKNRNAETASGVPANDPVGILRQQLAAAGGTPEQIDNLVCVDNLKKIGAAIAGAKSAPGDPLTLKNKLDTPLRLHCPKDITRKLPRRWADLQPSNVSYVFSASPSPGDPTIVRCPIHGHTLLSNGQVIQGGVIAK